MAQFKTYFRVVHSLSYLERIGNLELLRQEFQDNNREIAVLITERTNNANSAESSIFTPLIFDLLQKADQLAEGYIIEYLPNGTVGNISFKRLYQKMAELQNDFLNKDIGTNQKS
ncbi:hypothetical protein [Pedobacter frigidisoli]|uniref:hypothetical protein n=1 Tax=Pedobacter frigidisoli TaxID=2530455 RepID=UPI0029315C4D|nr:hypothetical protein [Pedobacter frigidisoli]